MFSLSGAESKLIYAPEKPDYTEYILDASKTMRYLGYKPRYGYLQGFKNEMKVHRFEKIWWHDRNLDVLLNL